MAIIGLIAQGNIFPKLYSSCIEKINFEKNDNNNNYELELNKNACILDIVGVTIFLENIENLRACCKGCNNDMKDQNLYEFKNKYFPNS
jgi:hypothetical protein